MTFRHSLGTAFPASAARYFSLNYNILMIKNFLKVAYRNLLRNKGFSAINITGLAVGMASAILIFLWIQNEVSYDQFHEKKDRIYEAWNQTKISNELWSWSNTPKILA